MAPSTTSPGSPRLRWLALVVVCLGQLMSILDSTIVNVALPDIERNLHFTQSSLTWVLNGYLITFGSLLLLGGRLGDLLGRRRVFLWGVTLFTLASLACGLAESQTALVIARFVQGVGGAGAVSATVAIIASEFPQPRERAQAMSIYMFVISGGGSLGLILGGVITELLNWHWIFFVNVPIGVAAVVLGRAWIAPTPGLGLRRDVDVLGSGLVTVALIAVAYAIVTASSHGWGSAHTLGIGGLAVALLVAFVFLESRIANPIMPLRIFRVPGLAASSLVRGLLFAGMFATFFIGVLYLERLRGYGVLTTGLAFLPQTVVLAALSLRPTPWLVARYGPRPVLLAGLVCIGAGLALLAGIGEHTAYVPTLAGAFVLIGLGAGLAMMPLLTMAMAQVPPADAGFASGIVNTSLQLSGAIAIAVFGTLSTQRTRHLLAGGRSLHASLLSGDRLVFAVAVGCLVAALIVTVVWFTAPALRRRVIRAPSAQAS